jgi:hypothetical protein
MQKAPTDRVTQVTSGHHCRLEFRSASLPLAESGWKQTQKAPRFRFTGNCVGQLRLNFLGGPVAADDRSFAISLKVSQEAPASQ